MIEFTFLRRLGMQHNKLHTSNAKLRTLLTNLGPFTKLFGQTAAFPPMLHALLLPAIAALQMVPPLSKDNALLYQAALSLKPLLTLLSLVVLWLLQVLQKCMVHIFQHPLSATTPTRTATVINEFSLALTANQPSRQPTQSRNPVADTSIHQQIIVTCLMSPEKLTPKHFANGCPGIAT